MLCINLAVNFYWKIPLKDRCGSNVDWQIIVLFCEGKSIFTVKNECNAVTTLIICIPNNNWCTKVTAASIGLFSKCSCEDNWFLLTDLLNKENTILNLGQLVLFRDSSVPELCFFFPNGFSSKTDGSIVCDLRNKHCL